MDSFNSNTSSFFRHLQAARALGVNTTNLREEDASKALVDRLLQIMNRLKVPNGLKALGFTENDIPELVQGNSKLSKPPIANFLFRNVATTSRDKIISAPSRYAIDSSIIPRY